MIVRVRNVIDGHVKSVFEYSSPLDVEICIDETRFLVTHRGDALQIAIDGTLAVLPLGENAIRLKQVERN